MIVEESMHVVFDETNKFEQDLAKISTEEDEQNIVLKNLENSIEIQPVDSAKQPNENLQQCDLPKEWRIPRDLSVDNIIGKINRVCLLEGVWKTFEIIQHLSLILNQRQSMIHLRMGTEQQLCMRSSTSL